MVCSSNGNKNGNDRKPKKSSPVADIDDDAIDINDKTVVIFTVVIIKRKRKTKMR